jgi:alkaline phosphatase D
MWAAERELGVRIVLLSGDRHEFGATRFPDPFVVEADPGVGESGPGKGIHEFCVGPLNMFYLPIRSYRQIDGEDVAVRYIPDGNSKFGAIHIDIDESGREESGGRVNSLLTYCLYVDGKIVWKYRLTIPLDRVEGKSLPGGEVLYDKVDNSYQLPMEVLGRVEEWTRIGWAKGKKVVRDLFCS